MLNPIVSQVEQEVKCGGEHCHEPVFRDSDLCFEHFIEKWDDRDAEASIFDHALDSAWWGDQIGEVCR